MRGVAGTGIKITVNLREQRAAKGFPKPRKYEKPRIMSDEFGGRQGQRRVVEHFDAIVRLVEEGATILGALKSQPEFPSYPTFSTVLKARPDLAARYREANRIRQAGPNARSRGVDYSRDEIFHAAEAIRDIQGKIKTKIGGGPHWETLRVRLAQDASLNEVVASSLELRNRARLAQRVVVEKRVYEVGLLNRGLHQIDAYRAAVSSLPRGLELDIRDDIVAEIVIDVLAGKLGVDEIEFEAREYMREHFRQFSVHAFKSLDEENWSGEDKTSFVDNITADDWIAA